MTMVLVAEIENILVKAHMSKDILFSDFTHFRVYVAGELIQHFC